ncbi:tripartite tricarboxylate transporter TctB family protein [Phaeovulum sp. W22_SRMD_FR3]|uniref:tripartite tricarboxylate transporter TctB family protein n=1 Tax=Phaeovulum sp. W22_SRMD_FR3 TaxID=3240274 RepID=UPI003F99A5D1
MSDRIFGGVGLLLAAFYIWAASIIPTSFMDDAIGSRTFPYIIGTALALCSLVFILRPDDEPHWPNFANFAEILFAAAVMFLYAKLLPVLGFIIATFGATTYLGWRLGSRPLGAVMTGVGASIGIYVVFHLVLGLSLAKGPFGF